MILHQYPGYTDEMILDLTLDRVRQMVSVISERVAAERHAQAVQSLNMAETVLKTLGSWLPALANSTEASKKLGAAAQALKLRFEGDEDDETEEKELPSPGQVAAFFGGVSKDGLIGVK